LLAPQFPDMMIDQIKYTSRVAFATPRVIRKVSTDSEAE
jgi:hypothetical protein